MGDSDINIVGFSQPVCIVQVRGERAKPFLQTVCTANVFDMQIELPLQSWVIDGNGVLMDQVTVIYLSTNSHGESRFLVVCKSERIKDLVDWFQALSDGFVYFGFEDSLAKVDGSVVIENIGRKFGFHNTRLLVLLGSGVAKLLESIRTEYEGFGTLPFQENWIHPIDSQNETLPVSILSFDPIKYDSIKNSIINTATAKEFFLGFPDALNEPEETLSALALNDQDRILANPLFDPRKPFFIGQSLYRSHFESPLAKSEFQYSGSSNESHSLPLREEHLKHGAKMITFAHWEMPGWYTGFTEEHRAVRQTAALFDLSHMGILEISGEDATWFLDAVTTNYVATLSPGQGFYSFFLDPQGNVLDDCYIYRLEIGRYMLVVNAVNASKILAWLHAVNSNQVSVDMANRNFEVIPKVSIRDLKTLDAGRDQRIDFALQGPNSISILCEMTDSIVQKSRLRTMRRNEFGIETIDGLNLIISRTGYTGEEFGFELYVHPAKAGILWNRLLSIGGKYELKPAGLISRDAARIESGFPLYGQELAGPLNISPIEAGYAPFIKFHKVFFVGRKALLMSEAQRKREIIRFEVDTPGKRSVRQGDTVYNIGGEMLGQVTSNTFINGRQIGLACIERMGAIEGSLIWINARRRRNWQGELKEQTTESIKATILPRFPDRRM